MGQKIDRSKIYYKITNASENHHGLQYHDGLVEDILSFNPNTNESCVAGGIYFTDLEHLPEFFRFGKWIRPIKLPDDAQVVLDPDGNKYRANKVFMLPRKDFNWYFDTKFNKDTFNWIEYSCYLGEQCHDYFSKWWDAKKFNWVYSDYLAIHCSNQFDTWWDAEKFNWNYSGFLTKFCQTNFDKWWDAEKFNWDIYSDYLAKYCSNHFDKWWDKDKFNWDEYSDYLAKYCSMHFNKWWDVEKFNWINHSDYLKEYCSKYKDIWDKK